MNLHKPKLVLKGLLVLVALPTMIYAGEIKHKRFVYEVKKNKQPLEIKLNIDVGEIVLKPTTESRKLTLDFTYSVDRFEVESNFNAERNRLQVYFDMKDWFKGNTDGDGNEGRAEIQLPTDVEIELRSRVKAGEIHYELGGLRLRYFYFKVWAGEVTVRFEKCNPVKLEDMEFDVKIGEVRLEKLGNARFQEAVINGGIGEMWVDLTGDCVPEFLQRVDLDLDIGETKLILPRDRAIKLQVSKFLFMSEIVIPDEFYHHGKYYYSPSYEKSENPLNLKLSPGLGSLDIRLR
ncbi:hypothetical protein B5M50_01350 [candidate division KSB1 bacterium 4484_219]|nr:hypothetical protein [bacterium]OQX60294.1 MAG: hypothetical protein B5M50_01350 [candidate division KSB1 bacterium 4484_219]